MDKREATKLAVDCINDRMRLYYQGYYLYKAGAHTPQNEIDHRNYTRLAQAIGVLEGNAAQVEMVFTHSPTPAEPTGSS